MKVGIIGSGGREHSICLSLKKSRKIDKLFCFTGNAGTKNIDENVNILIPISSNQSYLTIHKDAILKREGLSLAYVVEEKKVEIRPLKLGEAVGNRFIVLNGLKENVIVGRLVPAGTGNIKNKWNKKALEDDNNFLSEQEKIESPEPSETQANQ